MYARGVEFMERRKRAAAAAEAARLADEEKECTFRPKPATRVPGFMRVIAAKMRRGNDDGSDVSLKKTRRVSAFRRATRATTTTLSRPRRVRTP